MNANTQANINPGSITIIGRRWRDSYNNTYHVSEIYVCGKHIHTTERDYGYGEQYLYTAMDWLVHNGIINWDRQSTPWRWARNWDVELSFSVSDVKRKKDLI